MEKLSLQDCSENETDTTSVRCLTPETEVSNDHPESQLTPIPQPPIVVPWYGKSYMIIEKKIRKAITLKGHGLRLQDCKEGPNANNSWLCVCKDNYTGFFNTRSRLYLGHDGRESKSHMHAVSRRLDEWECFVPRAHPDGGYLLLSAFWMKQMWMVAATAEGRLMRGRHGNTLWLFEEI